MIVHRPATPLVLFCAAAGPRRGFGHLIRCGVLADALGVRRELAVRGSASTVHTALRLGWTVHRGGPARLVSHLAPDLLVVDEPSAREAAQWVRHARRHGVPVATIHDLGLARVASDLAIDGSVLRVRGRRPADLEGPAFAVLGAAVGSLRGQSPARARRRVLIALGGGANARAAGIQLARRMSRDIPSVAINLAAGFGADPSGRPLPPRCAWLDAPAGLAPALATATVAVVAGGVTLYEAAALGTPTVAVAIVAAQQPAIRAFADAGAAIDATAPSRPRTIARAVAHVRELLANPARAQALGRRGQRLVDGHGAARVARRLLALVSRPIDEVRHAA